MEEHEPFIAAIEACPEDHTARLVYADWLDERNHPAGEYLRTELRLASLPEGSNFASELQAKLRSLRSRIEPMWLARFDQPRMMLANPTPFPSAWWGIKLPGLRAAGTYSRFSYDSLPSLRYPHFSGAFDWLPPGEAPPIHPEEAQDEERYTEHFNRLVEYLTGIGLTVPADFVRWLTDRSVWRIPSCTSCYPDRSWDTTTVEGPKGNRVLPFYIDSQGCLTWYLYLTPDGYHAVLATGAILCHSWVEATFENLIFLDLPRPLGKSDNLVFVAPSVEAFFYRWWLENALWYKLTSPRFDFHDPTPITPEEQGYIDFYRQHSVRET